MRYLAVIGLLNILFVYKLSAQLRQSAIWAKDALKYIGKYEDVDGRVYKREIRTVKSCPDSILVVTYLGEPDDAEPYFIEVVKLNTKGESKEAQMARGFTAILHNAIQMKKFPQGVAVEGKIVLFEGKPAIITTYTHLVTVVVTH